ncbi:MAG: peptidyl-prolyl cis-trans isomerase [Helicobacteraceae bacterium]|nr:peptidyl-prolyl cis-trans isomerase [Helicobacteraceae bacterium]
MRFLSLFVCFALGACAQTVNAISAIAEGEPITLYEIDEFAKTKKISKAEALEYLIDSRLREAKIKELGISADEEEIDARIDLIAKRNNLDAQTLKEVLIRRGADFDGYRDEIKETIINEKIAAQVIGGSLIPVSQEEIERYYNANREKFSQPSEIVVIQYASKDERALRAAAQNPMAADPAVTTARQTLKSSELNPRLLSVLIQTPIGRFTPIFPAADRMVTLMVREKRGSVPMPLESVKDEIGDALRADYEARSIDDYFAKARAKAHISIIREPK